MSVLSAAQNKDPRDIIISPVVSEKSYGLIDEGKYTFVVAPDSNHLSSCSPVVSRRARRTPGAWWDGSSRGSCDSTTTLGESLSAFAVPV